MAAKSLGAGPGLLVLLTMVPSACQLFALVLAPRIAARAGRRFFLASGLVGRAVLLAVAFVHEAWSFLAILLVHALVQTAVIPVQNAVFQSNYHPSVRGRMLGWASSVAALCTIGTSLLAGALLDRDGRAYRYLYPAAGIAGFAALAIFGKIRRRRRRLDHVDPAVVSVAEVAPAAGVLATLRDVLGKDREFLAFESAFMLYGLGFMSIQPVLAPFLVGVMRMSYQEASAAKGAIFYLAMVLASPLAGMLHDRIGLERLAAVGCACLALFTGSLALTTSSKPPVLAAFALYGMAMAGIQIVWNMAPIRYAGSRDATPYMAVHVALVGVRALVGHPLGGAVAVAAGTPRATFALAALLFGSAGLWMSRLGRSAPGVVRS